MDNLLEVRDLVKHYSAPKNSLFGKKQYVQAVDGVSFEVAPSTTLGVVGESGCGKSTLGKALLRLIEPSSGQAYFKGRDILAMNPVELRKLRKDMQFIFQDPFSSLNPRMTVLQLVTEPLHLNNIGKKEDRRAIAIKMLEKVGINADSLSQFPHEFSGGQRQRIGIARALVVNPSFVLCDEAVSALDVSIQSQIINLLMDLQKDMGLTYIFISHDLSVIRHICDRVAVMYLGKIVEIGSVDEIFTSPSHPYTKALLSANLSLNPGSRRERIILKGEIPNAINLPSGCRFHTRCWKSQPICKKEKPVIKDLGNKHLVACHLCD